MMKEIRKGSTLYAIIVRNDFCEEGICFFTPNEFSQQLAYMKRASGYTIPPHHHNKIERTVHLTQEVLLVRKGKVRVDFYDDQEQYLESTILNAGDVVLFASGGHGLTVLEELEMIEVKQGPYAGHLDKTAFTGIAPGQVRVKE
jgi:mannose-6-phosphate isomerase-like protein (cupin superfamily)